MASARVRVREVRAQVTLYVHNLTLRDNGS
jgi:hypothetical protein